MTTLKLHVLGDRATVQCAISALAAPWCITINWTDYASDGPHCLIDNTVRLDVLFIAEREATPEVTLPEHEITIPASDGHPAGATVLVSYHGCPAADHLAAICQAMEAYPIGVDVGGVTRVAEAHAGWPGM